MPDVYVLGGDKTSVPMERIRVLNEDTELQQILERNFDLLPGDQISPDEPRRWLLIKREMPVPDPGTATNRFSLDFLFADQDATPTLVECKRFADMRARREIVGQMIEYAANGPFYWAKGDLRAFAEESAKNHGQALEDAIRNLQGPKFDSTEAFFVALDRNLHQGNIRMVFFLDQSPHELRSMVDFLSKQMIGAEVLLIEARQYKLNGTLIVVPKLFGYTEEVRKEIQKEMQSNAAAVDDQRRKWDKVSFFADAAAKLGEKVQTVRHLYDLLEKEDFGIKWGSGKGDGSFSPVVYDICPRTLISVFSSGRMWLNLGWLPEPCRSKLRSLWTGELGLTVNTDGSPTYELENWSDKVDTLVAGLVRVVNEPGVRLRSGS
jgi:hypothetical protein